MSENMADVTEAMVDEVDIAVAAWHEDGRWNLALLPDAHDLPQIIDRLKSQQTNGGAIAFPQTLAIGDLIDVSRSTTTSIGWYQLNG
jgi:hypothetical protein